MSHGQRVFLAAMGVLVTALVLAGCRDTRTVCYGIEPDGEVEKLSPCPSGWTDKQTKPIKEDEFGWLEVDENGVQKKNTKVVTITPKPTKR